MLQIVTKTSHLKDILKDQVNIGFVPTMGNLHNGHLSLLKESVRENQITVISIFVNPTQFAANEDFDSYPRTLEQDIAKIRTVTEQDIVIYAPESMEQVYLGDTNVYTVNGPTHILEGSLRPTHFDGVTTVVHHLFKIVKPTRAYFGKKDYQQLALIHKLNEQYDFGIIIKGMPIVRESTGLAMSSRNSYLTLDEKQEALNLSQTLNEAALIYKTEKSIDKVQEFINNKLTNKQFNYLELRESITLNEITNQTKDFVILGNYQIGSTKLLDNLEFK